MFSLTYYYIMFPWPMGMVVASLSSESTIPHSLRESGLPDCRVCQRRTREFLNKKILAHLGAVYSKVYTLFWPKTLYLHCILQGFYHFSFFGWLFKRTYKYFCAPAPQCFAFVHPRSRRKVPYSAVWVDWTLEHRLGHWSLWSE